MKETNNYYQSNAVIERHPYGLTIRPRRRRHGALNFNDRSPEYRAMTAHLRSARYASQRENALALPNRANGDDTGVSRIQPFLNLRRSYDAQVRRNFVRDVFLFAVIVTMSAWAIVHAVRAMGGP